MMTALVERKIVVAGCYVPEPIAEGQPSDIGMPASIPELVVLVPVEYVRTVMQRSLIQAHIRARPDPSLELAWRSVYRAQI